VRRRVPLAPHSAMAGSSPPQLSRVTPIVSWKRVGGNLRRWLAEYEEQSIRALISRHDGKSNERILAVWKLRKTAGNWRSLILTSEAIYDATLGHRSCKRRCHLATVRAITASTVSGQFLIHIDETYDALYVDRKACRARARVCLPHQLRRTPAPPHASRTAQHRTAMHSTRRTSRLPPHPTAPRPRNKPHRTTTPSMPLRRACRYDRHHEHHTHRHHHYHRHRHQHRHHQHRRHRRHTPAHRRTAPHAQNKEAAIDGIVRAAAKFRAVEVSLLHPPMHPLAPGEAATPTTAPSHPRTATPPPCLRCRS